MKRTFLSLITLLLAIFLLPGCGESLPDGMPRLYPASIAVVQEGTPLEGAIVQLIPENEDHSAWVPTGTTDAQGVAVLQTNGRFAGAPLGSYRVTVTKREQEPHPHPELAAYPPGDPNHQRFVEIGRNLRAFNLVAPIYSSVVDTPLRVEIVAGQRNYEVDAGEITRIEFMRQR